MLSPVKDFVSYIKLFKHYLGSRIYLIIFFSLFAALSEGFGILMLLPLLGSLDGSLPKNGFESEFNDAIYNLINFLGFSSSTSSIIILITSAFVFKGIVTFFALGFNAHLIGELLRELKARLYDHYTLMSYKYFSSKDAGHFTNLINEQPIKALEAFRQVTAFAGHLVNAIVLMALAFLMTWIFGLMALAVGIALLTIFMLLNSYVRKLSRITASENGNLSRWLIQFIHGFKYLTSTSQTHLLRSNIINSINLLTKNQVNSGIASAFTQAVREPIAVVFIMSIVYFQINVLNQQVEPILVSIVLFYRALNAMLGIQSGFQGTFQHIGSMELVHNEFTQQKDNQVLKGSVDLGKISKGVEFKNVSFTYNNVNQSVIDEISVEFPLRKSIAIVGKSGSGKSTLVDLISLMHEPHKGQIYINGINSDKINKSSWRSKIGYVSQETVIFDDTIANNISMWRGDYRQDSDLKETIHEAARQANIFDFIQSLPDGFESQVGDRGILLSGGQRQRLFIARELFRKPALLILDEATSSLDSTSEQQIQKSIESLRGQISIIIIAHRLSTIRNVDVIHLLEGGKIIESGSFESLIKNQDSSFSKHAALQSLR